MTIISKSCFRQSTCVTKLLTSRSLTWWIQGPSSTYPVFKYLKGVNLGIKNSNAFKDFQQCMGTLDKICWLVSCLSEGYLGTNFPLDITGHFGDKSCQAINCTGTDNEKITKSKAITEPRLVASYDIWPGIGVGLFQFLGPNTHIYIYLLYIFTYLLTFSGLTRGIYQK